MDRALSAGLQEWPPGLVGLGDQFDGMDAQEFTLGLGLAVWMAKNSVRSRRTLSTLTTDAQQSNSCTHPK